MSREDCFTIMKDKVKIGYIGLGRRGFGMFKNVLLAMNDIEVVAVCDLLESRVEQAQKALEEKGRSRAIGTTNYKEVLSNPDIEAVFIMTGWDGRPALAKESLLAGKYTAIEVGASKNLEEVWDLVDTYEQTKVPLMMLENACYGRLEMMMLNMVKTGVLGEIVHCTGAYGHYLCGPELFKDIDTEEVPHYRLGHYINENRDSYPTHELGPICKMLNINRGNRLVRLNTVASKAAGLKHYAKTTFGEDSDWAKIDYKQGDIVNTLITCENGESILITLDTTLLRTYYSRQMSVRGTLGMVSEEGSAAILEGMEHPVKNNLDDFYAKYEHPLQKYVQTSYAKDQQGGGAHAGGVDYSIFRAFIESVKLGIEPPIDIYDAATLLSIGVLTEESIKNNGAPVEIPDFTRGKYKNREASPVCKYSLNEIYGDEVFK